MYRKIFRYLAIFLLVLLGMFVIATSTYIYSKGGFSGKKYELKIRFPEGKYRMISEGETTFDITYYDGKQRLFQKTRSEYELVSKPGETEGTQKFLLSLKRFAATLDNAYERLEDFDSNRSENSSGLFSPAEYAVDAEITLIIDEKGNVLEFSGLEAIRENLPEDFKESDIEQAESLYRGFVIFLEDTIKAMPSEPVGFWDSWDSDVRIILFSDADAIPDKSHYTYKGTSSENGSDIAELGTRMKKKSDGTLAMQLRNATCNNLSYDYSSTDYLDIETGHLRGGRGNGHCKYEIIMNEGPPEYRRAKWHRRSNSSYSIERIP